MDDKPCDVEHWAMVMMGAQIAYLYGRGYSKDALYKMIDKTVGFIVEHGELALPPIEKPHDN